MTAPSRTLLAGNVDFLFLRAMKSLPEPWGLQWQRLFFAVVSVLQPRCCFSQLWKETVALRISYRGWLKLLHFIYLGKNLSRNQPKAGFSIKCLKRKRYYNKNNAVTPPLLGGDLSTCYWGSWLYPSLDQWARAYRTDCTPLISFCPFWNPQNWVDTSVAWIKFNKPGGWTGSIARKIGGNLFTLLEYPRKVMPDELS